MTERACYDKACDQPATKMIIIQGELFEIRMPACTHHADEIEQDTRPAPERINSDMLRASMMQRSDCGGNS